ncbi:hypothetical protein ACLOJK_029773 [Asimina triloba]
MEGIAKKGWEQYMLQLQHYPLRTKAITAGVLAGISDTVAQKLSGIQRLQLRRLLLKVLLGFAYGGPFGHFLHKLMDAIFKGKKDSRTVAKKVLLEQLTSSPWNNFLFLIYYGLVVEVLASCGMDQSSVYAAAVQSHIPQLCCMLLGNISESSSKVFGSEQAIGGFQRRCYSSLAAALLLFS